ncbi:hypothetical protein KFE25_004740 [Diacronema lutheri]|uniref:Uncharacterized protein n=1 Tax=Diacronema lutheri TaxID=2081491 RepID=A0A8J5XE13_DIALT|nr:hypothetical protein KFE25_004740 [Diacronema lutheri]
MGRTTSTAGTAHQNEPTGARALLQVFIAWCFCGIGYGLMLFFYRPQSATGWGTSFVFQQFVAIVMAVPGCFLSAVQSVRSLRAINKGDTRTLFATAIFLGIHTIVFTATTSVLLARTLRSPPVVIASSVHLAVQLPVAIAVIITLVQ